MEKFVPTERSNIVPGDCCKFTGLYDADQLSEGRNWSGIIVYNSAAHSNQTMTVGWDEIFIALPDPERSIRSPYTAIVRGQHFLHSSGKIFVVYDLPLEKLCTV